MKLRRSLVVALSGCDAVTAPLRRVLLLRDTSVGYQRRRLCWIQRRARASGRRITAAEKYERPVSLSTWRRTLPQLRGKYGWRMAKHEHMSPDRALTHAALVGHLLRGTAIEGKSFEEAVANARRAVGPDSIHFERHRASNPYIEGPQLDEAHYPSWAR